MPAGSRYLHWSFTWLQICKSETLGEKKIPLLYSNHTTKSKQPSSNFLAPAGTPFEGSSFWAKLSLSEEHTLTQPESLQIVPECASTTGWSNPPKETQLVHHDIHSVLAFLPASEHLQVWFCFVWGLEGCWVLADFFFKPLSHKYF